MFQVDEVRTATREEKKKLAMAMRAKQLKSIGLKTNEKGMIQFHQFKNIIEEKNILERYVYLND